MHKHYLIEQLRARGYDLISAETAPDGRIRSYPPTMAGMRAMQRRARNAVRPWDLLLLEVNARWTHRPVVVEINAAPEETLAYGSGLAQRGRVAIRLQQEGAVAQVITYADHYAPLARRLGVR
ncbi:MAG TPA: hypothetical protein VN812_15825 [Candidatus Acidoferrales bacterium]|nr:hypothetical protein [Candidatus Acidoferrales bacterium]